MGHDSHARSHRLDRRDIENNTRAQAQRKLKSPPTHSDDQAPEKVSSRFGQHFSFVLLSGLEGIMVSCSLHLTCP